MTEIPGHHFNQTPVDNSFSSAFLEFAPHLILSTPKQQSVPKSCTLACALWRCSALYSISEYFLSLVYLLPTFPLALKDDFKSSTQVDGFVPPILHKAKPTDTLFQTCILVIPICSIWYWKVSSLQVEINENLGDSKTKELLTPI